MIRNTSPRLLLVVLTLVLGTGVACAFTGVACPTPVPTVATAPTQAVVFSPFRIEVNEVRIGDTVVITLAVRSSGPQALLFEQPVLAGEFPVPESLEQARFDLLDLATAGEARIVLEFPRPSQDPPWLLVFNPGHSLQDVVAPRVEIPVEVKE